MPIKKSELYSSLWKSCDELRGGMDASQYKDYVLTLLFVKYVSDRYAGRRDALIVVPEGGFFADMVRLKGDKEIGDKVNKIIGRLAAAEDNQLKGVIDVADFNDEDKLGRGKEMVDRLSRLIAIFENLDLRTNRADGDDLLGDAYEYLMRHFATESGKSKGQFYTPAEVSRVMARVLGVRGDTRQDQSVYDPTCGSGSLLLKVHDEAPRGLSIFGQEMDNATHALARMNMILHDVPSAEVWQGNTLSSPRWTEPDGSLKTFDFVVANPPFSQKNWTSGLDPAHDEFGRFGPGVPPARNGDYAFLLHILKSLKSTGKAAVILPHGVLFRGNAEAAIRRTLVRRGVIKGIIGLPPNLFYGTSIPACIIVLDKEHSHARTGIFMIDASRGFMKDGNKNRLRARDIHRIVDVFTRQETAPGYGRMATLREIEENEYNLNLPRYIDSSEPEDLQDLGAHLNGGIPERDVDALEPFWSVLPGVRDALFAPGDRPGYLAPKLPAHEVNNAIHNQPHFVAFAGYVRAIFTAWKVAHEPTLAELDRGSDPRALIHDLSEDLLARFATAELVDRYAVYQHLMDYWAAVMQDDVHAIVQDGWREAAEPRLIVADRTNSGRETPDLVVNRKKYKTDLIPPALVVARYFAWEQAEIEDLETAKDAATQELEAFIEEHGGEEGLLEEATTATGNVTRGSIRTRLAEIRGTADSDDERDALARCLELLDAEATAEAAVKAARKALDGLVLAQYGKLAETEIKTLVVQDKWLAAIEASVRGEVERVTQQLAGRVRALEERYAEPLPKLIEEVENLSARVGAHLEKAGLLTGEQRLPGFSGEWEVKRLGEIGSFSKGKGISKDEVRSDGIPCVRYGEIYTKHHDHIRTFHSFISRDVARTSQRLRKGDLLFAGSGETAGEIGKCVAFLSDVEAYAGGDIVILSPTGQDSIFLGYLLNHSSVAAQKARMGQGDAVVHISARNLAQIELRLPPLDEQTAIAAVLSDMDAEIAALEARRDKIRAIKQGMMQELLTGRTRLL